MTTQEHDPQQPHYAGKGFGFWHFMLEREGWKVVAGVIYFLICLFDFIVMPIWVNASRPLLSDVIPAIPESAPELVKLELVRLLTETHEPLTMTGGGLLHLAFGALLTGAVIRSPGAARGVTAPPTQPSPAAPPNK